MINGTLFIMLFVGLFVSFVILGFFVWGAKKGMFDDSEKMMGGLLFDSEDDLNHAMKKEEKKKSIKVSKNEQKKSELP